MWPALILAVNRMARVIGRISLLTTSTRTKKIIKGRGAPSGAKWERNLFKS